MRGLGISSIRVRLTLWNMAIIALVLLCFGISSLVIAPRMLLASVDRDLERQVSEVSPQVSINLMSGTAPKQFTMIVPKAPSGRSTNDRDAFPHGGREVSTAVVRGTLETTVVQPSGPPANPEEMGSMIEIVTHEPGFQARINRGERAFSEATLNGKRFRVLAVPLPGPGNPTPFILVSYPIDELYNLLGTLRTLFLLLLPVALCATFLAGLTVTRSALRPVRQMTLAAAEAGAHDLSRRLPISGNDELSELAGTFNGLFERLQSSFLQLQSSVEQQKRFVADASHELRTPLTVIRGSASWALTKAKSESDFRDALEGTNAAAIKMEGLISDLLLLAKSEANQVNIKLSEIDLHELLSSIRSQVPDGTDRAEIEIECTPRELTARLDHDLMVRVLGNLVENAVRFTPAAGKVLLFARASADGIDIGVEDTGAGIPEEHVPHVFERFYRVDSARSSDSGSTGLGLAICKELVEAQGGSISIRSQIGVGTTVAARFPHPTA